MTYAIHIKTKSDKSRFVAIDRYKTGEVIAEGRTGKSVIAKAEKSGRKYSMMYIPPKGQKCIF